MSEEFVKELDVNSETDEEQLIESQLEPCECAEEDLQSKFFPPTHGNKGKKGKKDECFCLQVYCKTIEAILEAQKQILRCPKHSITGADEVGALQMTCRQPASCPPGFQGRYTVRSGDTMFFIAQRFGVSLQALIDANPHISNPSQIFPCDVLCVPGKSMMSE